MGAVGGDERLVEEGGYSRYGCWQVFRVAGAQDRFPFKAVEGVDADVHLSFDRYGVSLGRALRDNDRARFEEKRNLWPFLGQKGVTQSLYIPVNRTTEVSVCTADVIHR